MPTQAPAPVSGRFCGTDLTGAFACPSGEYCQPWNPWYYQCRRLAPKCGKQETGIDYYGADIAVHQLLLPEHCCEKCIKTAGCKAYTFVNFNWDGKAYCYLKSGSGQRSLKRGVVSASIAA
jgi:glucan 1,3-beta-glucosidase